MAFDELNRWQRDIAARRQKRGRKKFSLLLAPIAVPSSPGGRYGNDDNIMSRGRCAALLLAASFLLVLWIYFVRTGQKMLIARSEHRTDGIVRNKYNYWKASVVQQQLDEGDTAED